MRQSECRHRRRGYTLIELLVAMGIAAIFFTSFFAVVTTTMETLKNGDQRVVAQQNARLAMQTLMAELRAAEEIEPRAYYEAGSPNLPGLPRDPLGNNPLATANEAYPVLVRSTDADEDGYILLDHRDATGGDEQYLEFRTDGRAYEIKPLNPNRLTVKLNNPFFYGNTRYAYLDPFAGTTPFWDLDASTGTPGGTLDNSQVASTIVTYEYQSVPPRARVYDQTPYVGAGGIYDSILDGLVKRLYVMSGSSGSPLVLDTDAVGLANDPAMAGSAANVQTGLTYDATPAFYLLRTFQPEGVNVFQTTRPTSNEDAPSGLGSGDRNVPLQVPPVHLRQSIADHIIDVRFRYWTQVGGRFFEVRYDPDIEDIALGGAGVPDCENNGYYRYFDENGNEYFVWASPTDGKIDVDEADYLSDPQQYIDDYPFQCLLLVNEQERGMLLFEGWRAISGVSITLRAANEDVLAEYFSTIAFDLPIDPDEPDFGLGFKAWENATSEYNELQPLYQAVDAHRGGYHEPVSDATVDFGETDYFDVPEPLMSINFEPTRFVTLQSYVHLPLLRDQAREYQEQFELAFRLIKQEIQ